jgi:dolichyl-phosphate beta-glucosyltransferase
MLVTRGNNLLFVDADGATRFSDLELLEEQLMKKAAGPSGLAVAIGSRAHMVKTDAVVQVRRDGEHNWAVVV